MPHYLHSRYLLTLAVIPFALLTSVTADVCYDKPDGYLITNPQKCQTYFMCQDGTKIIQDCGGGQIFDAGLGTCSLHVDYPCSADSRNPSLIGRPCRGLEEQIRPSVIYCNKFLLCLRGTFEPVDCPYGMIFSEKTYKCIYPPDKCLPARLAPPPDRTPDYKGQRSPYIGICRGRTRTNVTDVFSCARYVFCSLNPDRSIRTRDGYVILDRCPAGYLFEPKYKRCRESKRVTCGPRFRDVDLYGPDPGSKAPPKKAVVPVLVHQTRLFQKPVTTQKPTTTTPKTIPTTKPTSPPTVTPKAASIIKKETDNLETTPPPGFAARSLSDVIIPGSGPEPTFPSDDDPPKKKNWTQTKKKGKKCFGNRILPYNSHYRSW